MLSFRTPSAVLLALLLVSSEAAAAPPPPPPSLGPGPAPNIGNFELLSGEIEHLEGLCQPEGQTFEFQAAGVAAGPYPGTFTEMGRVSIGPPSGTDLFNARVLGFESSFHIVSVLDGSPVEITGTKRIAFEGLGHCADVAVGSPFRSSRIFILLATYEARIDTEHGVFFDRGSTDVRLSEFFEPEDPAQRQASFSELFVSQVGAEAAKPGRGCGDQNHAHIRADECPMRN